MGDMCLLRPMIALYTLQLQQTAETNNPRIQDTANKFIDAAIGVMSHSDNLDPERTGHNIIEDGTQWIIFQALHQKDLMRAANGACLAIKMLASNPPNSTTTARPSQSPATSMIWPKSAVWRMVEGVVKTLIMKSQDLRSHLKEIVRLSIVAELVRQEGSWESKERRMRAGLEQFFQLCWERYAVDTERNGSDLMTASQSTLDLGDLFAASQALDLDPFWFDWGVDPLPDSNF